MISSSFSLSQYSTSEASSVIGTSASPGRYAEASTMSGSSCPVLISLVAVRSLEQNSLIKRLGTCFGTSMQVRGLLTEVSSSNLPPLLARPHILPLLIHGSWMRAMVLSCWFSSTLRRVADAVWLCWRLVCRILVVPQGRGAEVAVLVLTSLPCRKALLVRS